jgi:hypothetical protein
MKVTTDNLPYPAGYSPMTAKLPSFDPVSLMIQRKQAENEENLPIIPQLDNMDVQQLQQYCQQMGIAGVSSKLPPKAMLNMIRAKMGDREGTIQGLESQGYKVVGKDYPQPKQILKG